MSYRQQLRRDRQTHRRDQGLAILNRRVSEALEQRLAEHLAGAVPVTGEASTPVDHGSPGVS